MSELRYFFENAYFREAAEGSNVMADPVFGIETVVAVREERIFREPSGAGSYEVVLRLGLKREPRVGDPGGVRYVARFPHEPVLRVLFIPSEDIGRIQRDALTIASDTSQSRVTA